jgi:septal ring factor EnvC (AmiA/AmiB activator)
VESGEEAPMSKLDSAAERFAAALEALEKAVLEKSAEGSATGTAKMRDDLAKLNARLAAMTAERDQLLARIAELEDETRSLTVLNTEVEGRLDGAIAEIRAVLGN